MSETKGKHSLKRAENPKKTFLRLLMYFKNEKLKLALLFVLILIGGTAGIAGAFLLRPLLNLYIIPLIGESNPDLTGFKRLLLLMAGIYMSGAIANFTYTRMMVTLSTSVMLEIRKDLFTKMQKLLVSYFDKRGTGKLMSHYTNDADSLREMLSQGFPQLVSSAVIVSSAIIMMLIINPLLTIICISLISLIIFVVKAIGKRTGEGFRSQQEAIGSLNSYIEEMIEGQKVIRVFNETETTDKGFSEHNKKLQKAATKANTFANILMPIAGNLAQVQYALIAAIGTIMAINRMIDIGAIATFLQYTRIISQPVAQLSQLFNSILSALAGAERIFKLIDEDPEPDSGTVKLDRDKVKGDVRLNDIFFSYDGRQEVLKGVSFYAKPGQKIALVGATGAGKTTIANLLTRYYEVSRGEIIFDGIRTNEIDKASLRRSVGLVLQDTKLFTDTVMENIRYGKPDATDEEVIEAAKLSNADGFIKHLPDGYNTVLQRAGDNLSQGQRQLIAIARVYIADCPVLILDEATSSIDTRTERLIQKGMESLMKGRTVFVIAHRLSTIVNSDVILVIDDGKIIERGDHEQLIAEKGMYYELYSGITQLA